MSKSKILENKKSGELKNWWGGKSWNRVRQEAKQKGSKIPADLKSVARNQERRGGRDAVSQRHEK